MIFNKEFHQVHAESIENSIKADVIDSYFQFDDLLYLLARYLMRAYYHSIVSECTPFGVSKVHIGRIDIVGNF